MQLFIFIYTKSEISNTKKRFESLINLKDQEINQKSEKILDLENDIKLMELKLRGIILNIFKLIMT